MIKVICENRKARHDYELLDKYEAGVVLKGSEVKSLRRGQAHLNDAYGDVHNEEVFLYKLHIAPLKTSPYDDHEPNRKRKLLLHKIEISRLIGKVKEKGLTLVPTKLYFKNGKVKVELALGKSKKKVDKRETLKKKSAERQIERALKSAKR